MTVTDPRYSAELVTRTGKVLVFDDIGCLATFLASGELAPAGVHSAWAHDYVAPGEWARTSDLSFVHSDSFHTPMGSGLVALARVGDADSLGAAVGGELLDWAQVLARNPGH